MLEIVNCEQGTPEWLKSRAGIPTASQFQTVMAKGRDGGASKTRRSYMLKLAGELITGEAEETYSNAHMERGKVMEAEARERYAFEAEADPIQIGFIRNGPKGCSPDSLIGTNGALEIKTKLPHLAIDCLLRGEFPAEHKAQCQGVLWVGEREWIDLAVYWPGIPLFVKRAYRDEPYIAQLAEAVDAFNAELAEVVSRVRAIGAAPRIAA